jgi:uncharacterized protein involved in exopolysaccharide biosynthesis
MAWRKPSNLRDWLALVLRHRKKAFFPACLITIVVLVAGLSFPKEYNAESKFQGQNDLIAASTGSSLMADQLQRMRTQVSEEFRGRAAIVQLIDDLALRSRLKIPQDQKTGELTAEGQLAFNDLIQKLRSRILVYSQAQTDTVDQYVVSYTDDDKELVPKVANQLVENYIRRTREQLDEMLLTTKSFFEKEKSRWDGRVIEVEQKKMRFEMDNRGMLPDDPAGVQKLRDDARKLKASKAEELKNLKDRQAGLEKFINDPKQPDLIEKEGMVPNPAMIDLRARLKQAEAEYDAHKQLGRKDNHPLVQAAVKRINDLKDQIAKTPEQIKAVTGTEVNMPKVEARKELRFLLERIPSVAEELRIVTADVDHYDAIDSNFYRIRNEYVQMKNDLEDAREQRKFWDDNLRRTTIAISVDLQQKGMRLTVIQRAPDQIRPSKPNSMFILGVALAAGLGTAGIMILLAELLDRSFHSVEQAVDDLKLPVLGAVNEIVTPAVALRRRILGLGVVPAFTLLLLAALAISYYLLDLNLHRPQQYDELVRNPKSFIRQTLLGG